MTAYVAGPDSKGQTHTRKTKTMTYAYCVVHHHRALVKDPFWGTRPGYSASAWTSRLDLAHKAVGTLRARWSNTIEDIEILEASEVKGPLRGRC